MSTQINGRRLVRETNAAALKPDPLFTVSEWADQYRVLTSVTSAEPGQWRTSRTPYLREIMDSLSALSPIQEVVLMKGSQLGGSEAGNNWIGYIVDHSPAPTMMVQPTEGTAKRYSKQRLDSLIRECPRIRGKVREKKSRESGNTTLMKEFNGGVMVITGANSGPGLRSMPARYMFLDEIDAYPDDVDGEGDPVELAEARARTFSRRKIFKNSTPTIEKKSRIEAAYLSSDQRKYYVPCPHCDFYQVLVWERIKWERDKPYTAHYVCINCEAKIEEHHKGDMLEKGKWIAENKDADPKVAGFHISTLYSPLGWFSWADCVRSWLKAQKNPTKLRVFVNTILGQTWKERGDAPDWTRLYERREPYKFNVVPKGGLFITAGVDVQKDRFEVEIVAWGKDKQSWSLDYRIFECDTSIDSSYDVIAKLKNETFPVEGSTARLPIRLIAMDSGFNTQPVYNFVRNQAGRIIAVKGSDTQQSIIGLPSSVDVSYGGKKISKGARVWPVGSSIAKSELYAWLNLMRSTDGGNEAPPCYCHFPEYSDEFFKMLTAEQIVKRIVRGFPRYQWEKTRDRNEALDCRVYSRAAAEVVGLSRYTSDDWKEMENSLRSEEEPEKKEMVPTKSGIRIKPSQFL